jgi:peptidoglycan/xylan/chitin deacetylase (PgdA/CDA1 family)
MKKILISVVPFLISMNLFAQNQVAFTVDDLPFVMERSLSDAQESTTKFLQSFKKHNVEAVAFVNEQFVLNFGTVDARIEILNQWVKAGHELGNHTFSHPSFNETSLEDYTDDFIRGEAISKKINGKPLRYFRHPYLHTGNDSVKRFGFDDFLQKRNYQIAPVTVDSYDWYYNKVYTDALKAGDQKLAKEIGEEYVEHTIKCFDYFDKLSKEVLGRSVKHIFLCHANRLNADYMDKVLTRLTAEKYEFINLEEALKDEAYSRPVSIEASRGVWLHRWRITEGKKTELEAPERSERVTKLFEGK